MAAPRQDPENAIGLIRALLYDKSLHSLVDCLPIPGKDSAFLLKFSFENKQHSIQVSRGFLADLGSTTEYQAAAHTYIEHLRKRMMNPSPAYFLCRCAAAVALYIEWPFERVSGKDALEVGVHIRNLQSPTEIALASVEVTGQQSKFDLRGNPFLRERLIVDTVRQAIDEQRVEFQSESAGPSVLHRTTLPLRTKSPEPLPVQGLEDFLARKVFWLGFRQGDKRTKVWISDSWDAQYLGTSTRSLVQRAQVLENEGLLLVDLDGEFASVGPELLKKAREIEEGGYVTDGRRSHGLQSTGKARPERADSIEALIADPDLKGALSRVWDRWRRLGKSTAAHELRVKLGTRWKLLDELAKNDIIRCEGEKVLPRFAAIDFLDHELREEICAWTDAVFKGLRRLYVSDGPRMFSVSDVIGAVHAIDSTISANELKVGMLMATDFLMLCSGWTMSPDEEFAQLGARHEILDYESLEQAWADELRRRQEEVIPRTGSNVPAPAKAQPANFSFVGDAKLRQIIERDFAELQLIKTVGATLSRMIMAGRLIEGLLLDAVRRHQARALAALRAPKEKGGKSKNLEQWDLSSLIDVALELGFLRAQHEKQSHGVREFRNLVHPGWELRSELVVRDEEANIAEEFLRIVILDLPERSK